MEHWCCLHHHDRVPSCEIWRGLQNHLWLRRPSQLSPPRPSCPHHAGYNLNALFLIQA
jgi:hypothetical protein